MTDTRALLSRTAELAADFLDSLEARPVFPQASPHDLRQTRRVPLQGQPLKPPRPAGPQTRPAPPKADPLKPQRVVEELVAAADPGLVAMPSGRYFGFVI